MSRWQNIEGQGAVCFESDGRVRLVVSDEVADRFMEAERAGVTADELVSKIIDEAERDRTGPIAFLPTQQELRDMLAHEQSYS